MTRRIAFISDHASPLASVGGVDCGGQNVYVDQVARRVAGHGYAVDIFTRRDSEAPADIIEYRPGVRVIHVPAGPAAHLEKERLLPFMDAFAGYMTSFIGANGPYDIIHAHFFMSGLVAAHLKERFDIPFLMTFHALGRVRRRFQGDADRFPLSRIAIEERLVREADGIVAECPQDLHDLVTLYKADPERIRIIPCGFDPDEFETIPVRDARMHLGFTPAERIVLHLGRMVPRKGVDNVIRACALLRTTYGIPVRLLIAGGESPDPDAMLTPEIGRLQDIAAREGLGGSVSFAGKIERRDLKWYYSAADIFVTTPWYEPFGITPVEAMACGTPVIGSKVGGIRFSVEHGSTGLLVPPEHPARLAEAMAWLFRRPSAAALFRFKSVERAHRLFTWEKVCRQILDYSDTIVAAQGRLRESHGRLDVDPIAPLTAMYGEGHSLPQ